MPHFLILEGSLSNGNRGVNALTLGTIKAITDRFPSATFSIFGFLSRGVRARSHMVDVGGPQIAVGEVTIPLRRGLVAMLRAKPGSDADPILRLFADADAVIDLAAGDGFGDTYGWRALLGHSLGKLIALRARKLLALFPQTIGPFRSRWSATMARSLLRRADLICVRDQLSQRIVDELLDTRPNRCVLLADMAFLMEPANPSAVPGLLAELPEHDRPIGVNVSGLLWHRGLGASSQGRDRYRESILHLVVNLRERTRRPILLIPHVFTDVAGSCDFLASQEVETRLSGSVDGIHAISRHYSAPEVKALISQCDLFIGSRMHACIAALSTETPLVPVGYSHKFAGIMAQFRLDHLVADWQSWSPERLLDHVLDAYANRIEVKKSISEALPAVCAKAEDASGLLAELLVGHHA